MLTHLATQDRNDKESMLDIGYDYRAAGLDNPSPFLGPGTSLSDGKGVQLGCMYVHMYMGAISESEYKVCPPLTARSR